MLRRDLERVRPRLAGGPQVGDPDAKAEPRFIHIAGRDQQISPALGVGLGMAVVEMCIRDRFEASGAFDSVDCQIAGLGGVADVEQLYIAHTKAAIDSLNG